MMRKVREKISYSLNFEDETALNQYFQNRKENFYGNTVESGWIKEEQQQRILALEQWKKDCEFCIENVNIEFVVSEVIKNANETIITGSEWNQIDYRFNYENSSRSMLFETVHVIHVSEEWRSAL